MRGKVLAAGLHNLADRITPAYAGKSESAFCAVHVLQDHPRVCGEKARCGSVYPWQVRITPAHAGKSIVVRSCSASAEDHPPHMRGKGLS